MAGLRAVTTWNPGDAGSGFTFSGGNLNWSNATLNSAVRGTTSRTSGKLYFEVTLTSTPNVIYIGVGYSTASLSTYAGGDANGWAFNGSGFRNNGAQTSYGPGWATGNVIGFAFDFGAHLAWMSVNGSFTGSPSAGTGGMTIGSASPLFPLSSTTGLSGTEVIAANFGQFAFAHSPPTGFSAWG